MEEFVVPVGDFGNDGAAMIYEELDGQWASGRFLLFLKKKKQKDF